MLIAAVALHRLRVRRVGHRRGAWRGARAKVEAVVTQYYTMKIADGAITFTPVPSNPVDPPAVRVLFASPVTGVISDTSNPYGLDWFDATGYAAFYKSNGVDCYHTGADLNRPAYQDSGKQVYAAADGRVAFQGTVQGWQAQVVVIRHALEDGSLIWTRYAHIKTDYTFDHDVKRGDRLGLIADYVPVGPQGDHLHFDVATVDLGERPGDWPGMDKARLVRNYKDPAAWLKERSK